MSNSISLKIEFTDCWEFDELIDADQRWLAVLHSIPGTAVTAPTKDKAFEEIMISLRVKAAYDSNYQLP